MNSNTWFVEQDGRRWVAKSVPPHDRKAFAGGLAVAGPLDADEVERGLVTMLRFRFAVQADYFARRLVRGDLTGIDSAAGNEQGLEDARRGLRRPSKVDILQ